MRSKAGSPDRSNERARFCTGETSYRNVRGLQKLHTVLKFDDRYYSLAISEEMMVMVMTKMLNAHDTPNDLDYEITSVSMHMKLVSHVR